MKIYIAGSKQDRANKLGDYLSVVCGHVIVSSWLYATFKRTTEYDEAERLNIAETDMREVADCDCLILLSDNELVAGGKFVELGAALALGKHVIISGRRENMLCWHPAIKNVNSDVEILNALIMLKNQLELI